MQESFMKIALLVFIACGTLYLINGINLYVKDINDTQSKNTIKKALVSECRAIKESQKYPNNFHSTARTLEKMLGRGVSSLDENTYLEIISMCLAAPGEKL